MIKVVQNTDIPGFTVSEVFSYVANVGYDGIDYLTYIRNFYVKPKRIIALSKKHNIPILTLHQPKLLVPLHPRVFFRRMIKLIQFFPDLQVSNYHLSGFINVIRKDSRAVQKFITIAKEHHTLVSFESNARVLPSLLYPKETYLPDSFKEFCTNHSLSMTFDVSHIADNKEDIIAFFQKNHKHIRMIHMSDYHDGIGHLPLGLGSLPIKQLLQEIKRVSWNGIMAFEIKKFPGAKTKQEKLHMLKESLQMVRKYT